MTNHPKKPGPKPGSKRKQTRIIEGLTEAAAAGSAAASRELRLREKKVPAPQAPETDEERLERIKAETDAREDELGVLLPYENEDSGHRAWRQVLLPTEFHRLRDAGRPFPYSPDPEDCMHMSAADMAELRKWIEDKGHG